MAKKTLSKYFFNIGNECHDINIAPIEAFSKKEALDKARQYRAVPTDHINLYAVKPICELKRINGKMKWVDIK